MPEGTCTVDGCDSPSRSPRSALCGKHYHRLYRHGSLDRTARGVRTFQRRYQQQHRPSHPLAMRNGHVYIHRATLYDAIGPGPHPCHWCDTTVHWRPTDGQAKLVTDHLDSDGSNNDPNNLVPSCLPCNTKRGNTRWSEGLRAAGWFSVNDTPSRLRQVGGHPSNATLTTRCTRALSQFPDVAVVVPRGACVA